MTKKLVWPATLLASFAFAAACGGSNPDDDGMGGEGGADGSSSGGSPTDGSGGAEELGGNAGDGGLGGDGPVIVVPLTCSDDLQNEEETDVDCGGPVCDPCELGSGCVAPSDCESGVCESETCSAAACGDGVVNGTEPCDDGRDTARCNFDCTLVECGDGYINEQAGEICEPDPDLDVWQRCGRTCIIGVDLDGTWRENDLPGANSPWERLEIAAYGGAVPALQSFHYIDQPLLYDFYTSEKYDIKENAWFAMAEPTPFYAVWANGAVDSQAIWIPRAAAMHRFDLATETWTVHTTPLPDGTEEDTAAVFDGDGYIWYAGGADNLIKYDPNNGTYEERSYTVDFPGFDVYETRLAYDPISNKILATGFGNSQFLVFDLAAETFSTSSVSPAGAVKDNSCQDRAGGVYVGSPGFQFMYRYDIAADTFTELPQLPVNHDNWSTCVVSEVGYLYYGTDSGETAFARLRLNHH